MEDAARRHEGKKTRGVCGVCGVTVRRLTNLVTQVTSNNRLEWLVVASILALLAVAFAIGWIRIDLPKIP